MSYSRELDQLREVIEAGGVPTREQAERLLALLDEHDRRLRLLTDQLHLLDRRVLAVENSRVFRALHWAVRILSGWRGRHFKSDNRPARERAYRRWVERQDAASPPDAWYQERIGALSFRPLFSLLLRVDNPRREWLEAMLSSVRAQHYPNWELCVCDDASEAQRPLPEAPLDGGVRPSPAPAASPFCASSSKNPWVDAYFGGLSEGSTRVQYVRSERRMGPSSSLNRAGILASGDYLVLLPQHGTLAPDALFRFAESLQQQRADMLYADEDRLDASGLRTEPVFKPGWSPDLLAGSFYTGPFLAIARGAMDRAGWFNAEFDGAHDYDLARRIGESGGAIAHVPQVLVHQREVRTTLARSSDRRVVGAPLASIVICSRNARLLAKCLRQIEANTAYAARELVIVQHRTGSDRAMERLLARVDCTRLYHDGAFDFSGMNNRAARAARGEILVFLNDDCEPLDDRWLGELIAHAQRSNVGAVGARLLYPTGAVQHAGVAIGIMDGAGHPHRGTFDDNFWPWSLHTRNVSAVTGACLAMRREIFQELGGFDPCFPNNYNDIDLCLRARRQGYQVIYEPAALLRHQESKTRTRGVAWTERALWQERWGEALAAGDPYYSRHLTRTREDCSLADG